MTERSERDLLEGIEARLDRVVARLEAIEHAQATASDAPEAAAGDSGFERRMNLFVAAGLAIAALATWLAWRFAPPFFPIAFGTFFVFFILSLGLVIDEFVLPTPTFRRISTHALAVAVFWLSLVFLAVSGVQLGVTIVSDPFGGEEGRAATVLVEGGDPLGAQPDGAPAPPADAPVAGEPDGGARPDAPARP
jgi:hypothetical protein